MLDSYPLIPFKEDCWSDLKADGDQPLIFNES